MCQEEPPCAFVSLFPLVLLVNFFVVLGCIVGCHLSFLYRAAPRLVQPEIIVFRILFCPQQVGAINLVIELYERQQ